jgi:hypothetical protein
MGKEKLKADYDIVDELRAAARNTPTLNRELLLWAASEIDWLRLEVARLLDEAAKKGAA